MGVPQSRQLALRWTAARHHSLQSCHSPWRRCQRGMPSRGRPLTLRLAICQPCCPQCPRFAAALSRALPVHSTNDCLPVRSVRSAAVRPPVCPCGGATCRRARVHHPPTVSPAPALPATTTPVRAHPILFTKWFVRAHTRGCARVVPSRRHTRCCPPLPVTAVPVSATSPCVLPYEAHGAVLVAARARVVPPLAHARLQAVPHHQLVLRQLHAAARGMFGAHLVLCFDLRHATPSLSAPPPPLPCCPRTHSCD